MSQGMIFMRYGGLSAQKQTHGYVEDGFYYGPPRRRGLYAFPFPYMEMFYVQWSDRGNREVIHKGVRKFYYDGPIWCHLTDKRENQDEIETVGSWREVDMAYYKKLLDSVYHQNIKQLMTRENDHFSWMAFGNPEKRKKMGHPMIINPYKTGLRGWMSRDHLEVFISGEYCARIR